MLSLKKKKPKPKWMRKHYTLRHNGTEFRVCGSIFQAVAAAKRISFINNCEPVLLTNRKGRSRYISLDRSILECLTTD